MIDSEITAVSAPRRRRVRISPPHARVEAALQRIAAAWGTDVAGWHGQFAPGIVHVSAYVTDRHTVVATASHRDLLIALRQLAWELDELGHV